MYIRGVCSQVNRFQVAKVGIGLFAVTSVIFSSFLIARVYSGNFPKSLDAKWLRDLAKMKFGTVVLLVGSVATTLLFTYIYFKRKAKRDSEFLSAAQSGDVDRVGVLLGRGANVNAVDRHQETALMHAARNGHAEVVRLLLDKGANFNAVDCHQWTALMHAAFIYGHAEVVRLLLDKGANVNAVDRNQWTALMNAAEGGHTEVVRLLLENGAIVHAVDRHQRTALMHAAEGGHPEMVSMLLDKGAGASDLNYRLLNGSVVKLNLVLFKNVYKQWINPEMREKQNDYKEILILFIKHGFKIPENYKYNPQLIELINNRKVLFSPALR